MKTILRILVAAALAALFSGVSHAQPVIRMDSGSGTIADKWASAIHTGREASHGGFWIGYSIQRTMGERSFVGSYFSDRKKNRPALEELITGMKNESQYHDFPLDDNMSMSGTMTFGDEKKPERKAVKEIAMLFHLRKGNSDAIDDVKVSNLSLHVDLEDEPLYWLGASIHSESLNMLESRYADTRTNEIKKDLMMAISMHDETQEAVRFLKNILEGDEPSGVREDAAFWLGQTQSPEALKILTTAAQNDKSGEVCEKAIFAISQIEGDASTDVLIDLAKNHRHGEMRKKAAFWLGQKASEKAVGALKELAYKDPDTDVQRNALFALTQIRDGESVDELIKIAKTHKNPKIRKEAIFWLGQCENPKALEALIDIIKN